MKYIYYIISFLSGVMELGSVFWGLSQGYDMKHVIGLVFAYQLGNVIYYFVSEKASRRTSFFVVTATATCIIGGFIVKNQSLRYILILITLIIGSTFLQLEREAFKIKVFEWEKWKKRASRVVGFFVASSFALKIGTFLLLAVLLILLAFSLVMPAFSYEQWKKELFDPNLKRVKICWPMITHQAHYFVYTYVLCAIVFKHYDSALWASIWFVLNWIPYTITEPLVKVIRIERFYKHIAIFSHLFNGIVLIGVFVFVTKQNILAAVILWMLTGFGGGNIFCVKSAMKPYVDYSTDTWMFSEQIGHILGMIVCLLLVLVNKSYYTLLAASGFALITIPLIIGVMQYHKKHG